MKTYFDIRSFLWNARYSTSAALVFRSYKINGVETLTPQYFIDTQSTQSTPAETFEYCTANEEGTVYAPSVPSIVYSNNFNPFRASMGLEFPEVAPGIHRGKCTGAVNGHNYGAGVLNIYCDKQKILLGLNVISNGDAIFCIDIDYTKDLHIEFDLIGNYHDSTMYREPEVYRQYVIDWKRETCTKTYYYKNAGSDTIMPDDALGFLAGNTKVGQAPYIDLSGVDCSRPVKCEEKERTRSFAMFVTMPEEDEPRESLKECCYGAVVLADPANYQDYEKNDFTGVFHKRQLPNETVDFVLINVGDGVETPLDGALGDFKPFGSIENNPDLSTAIVDWATVLDVLGEGTYTVLKRIDIAGVTITKGDINYTLRKYSTARADKTVRIDAYMDGYMEKLGIDFAGSGFKTSSRFGGFFGRREPKYEEDNITYSNFVSEQISMMQTNEYTLQSNLLPSCITQPLFDFLLFANDIFVNDYNLNNHLRNFVKFPVKFGDNKGTGYFSTTAKAILNLSFTDKNLNNIKRNF